MKLNIIRNKLTETILVLAIAYGLSINLLQAFWVPDSQRYHFFSLFLYCAAICIALQLVFFNKKVCIVSLPVAGAMLAGFFVYMQVHPAFQFDMESVSPWLFWIIGAVASLLVFVCAKTRLGILLLFLSGLVTFFFICVLGYQLYVVGFLLYFIGTVILYLVRQFAVSSKKTHSAQPSGKYTLIVTAICLAVLAISSAGYLAIRPFTPKPDQLNLITAPQIVKLVYYFGISIPAGAPDESIQTSLAADTQVLTKNKEKVKRNDGQTGNGANSSTSNKQENSESQPTATSSSSPNLTSQPQRGAHNENGVRYDWSMPWYIILLLCVGSFAVLVICPFLIKRYILKIRHARITKLAVREQVINSYTYFIRVLSTFGYRRHGSFTPAEYARKITSGVNAVRFDDYDFNQITAIYTQTFYGGVEPRWQELTLYESFYKAFLKLCRNNTGLNRFLLKYLFL